MRKPKNAKKITRSVVAGKVVKQESKVKPAQEKRSLPQGLPVAKQYQDEDAEVMEYQFGKQNYNKL